MVRAKSATSCRVYRSASAPTQLRPCAELAHSERSAFCVLRPDWGHATCGGSLRTVDSPCGLWEQGEEIVQMRGDVLRIEAGHARGGELDPRPARAIPRLRRDCCAPWCGSSGRPRG